MQVKQRRQSVFQITGVGPYASTSAVRRRRRRWLWAPAAVAVLVIAGIAFAFFAWPRGSLAADGAGLARLGKPGFGGGSVHVSARTAGGLAIPVTITARGVVWPARPVAPGTRLELEAVFRRPGWVGWAAGRTQRVRLWVTAPAATVSQRWLQVKPGAPLRVRFSRPVRAVEVAATGKSNVRLLARPSRSVSLGRLGDAGRVEVSAVARRWERFPPAVAVTWFATGSSPQVIATPAPGSLLGRHTPLVLQFSKPVGQLLRRHTPWLGRIPGSWRTADLHTLVFTPRGFGFGLDTEVRLHLPTAVRTVGGARASTRLITWRTPTGSPLRLQQLLARLGYLPLRWHASGTDAGRTLAAQLAAAVDPPTGSFAWRYPNAPDSLRRLWKPGRDNDVTRGAVMAFESDHGLTTDGYAGRQVWQALIQAAIGGERPRADYSYVIVHRSARPQTLVLWHDGKTVLTTPANTGIPSAPTVFGTFPVYGRFRVTTMSGTAPDGSHYSDPGIPWVSYFNGGDAIHGFTRANYGSPQSLGCVELPASEAAKVWPYTPIGTLVTVTS